MVESLPLSVQQEWTGPDKQVSLARLRAFSGGPLDAPAWPIKNIHTDPEYARTVGLETAGAAGVQYEGYLVDLMVEIFGVGWLTSGSFTDIKFTAPVPLGSSVRAQATIVDRTPAGGGSRFTLAINCVDAAGNAVLVGTATTAQKTTPRADQRAEIGTSTSSIVAQNAVRGDVATPIDVVVTKDLNDQFLFALDTTLDVYQSSAAGRGIVHPALLLNMSNPVRSPGYSWADGTLGIHAGEDTEFLGTMLVGETAHIEWEVRDTYERRGRRFTVVDVTISVDGRDILKRRVYETYAAVS